MNKKFSSFFEKHDLEIDKNNAYGLINNYETNVIVRMFDNESPLYMHISFYATEDDKKLIYNELANEKIKFFRIEFDDFGMSIGLNDITAGALLKRLDNVLDKIYDILKRNNAKDSLYCPLCGNEFSEEAKKYPIGMIKGPILVKMEDACSDNLDKSIQKANEEFDNQPNNYMLGFLGAMLGAGIGCIIYIILSFIGFVSVLSSAISAMLGGFFYKKFGGKPTKAMLIIISAVTIISQLLVVFVLYLFVSVGLYYAAKEQTVDMFSAMSYCINNVEGFSDEFIENIILSIIFSIIGVGIVSYQMNKGIKRPTK